MADSYVRVPADSSGKKVDATSLDVGIDTVYRQRIVIADNSATAQFAVVTAGALTITGNVNISATAIVAGSVAISGTAVIAGSVAISGTPSVVLAVGTNNIGLLNHISRTVEVAIATPFTLNNISATVTVAGNVNISATAQVAISTPFTVNDISRTVQVAVATPFIVQGISTTVNVAIATPFTVNDISATVIVAVTTGGTLTDGTSYTSQAAPYMPIGGIFDDTSTDTLSENDAGVVRLTQYRAIHANLRHADGNVISTASALPVHVVNATSTATVITRLGPVALPSASHGPKNIVASTSAAVVLIADPGASNSIYITQIMAGNFSSTLTRARIGTSASPSYVVQALAANGGGFVLNFDPPWKLSANSTAICSVKPNVSEVNFTVNFYVDAT